MVGKADWARHHLARFACADGQFWGRELGPPIVAPGYKDEAGWHKVHHYL